MNTGILSTTKTGSRAALLARLVPYACLFLVIAATGLLWILGMRDLLLKSTYVSVPVAAACLVAVLRPGLFRESLTETMPRLELGTTAFRNLVLVFFLLYSVSLVLLFLYDARPLAYFVMIGLMSAVLFLQVFASYGAEHNCRRGLFVCQAALLSANLIFGQTLRLPYFFGWGDSIVHMQYMQSILDTGRVTAALADYEFFPGFHLYTAAAQLLGGLDLTTTYFLINGLVFLVSVPAVYLLVKRLTASEAIPMVAVLLYVLSREVIFNGMYMITRVTAFIFCLVLLDILLRSRDNVRLRALAFLLVVPLVLVHQTTLAHFSMALVVLVLLELFLARREWHIGMTFTLFFILAYLGYWMSIETPLFTNAIRNVFVPSGVEQVAPQSLDVSLSQYFLGNLDNILLAFLTVLGVIVLLRLKKETLAAGFVFAVFALAAFIAYFPGFTDALSQNFLSYRLRFLAAPFVVFAAAGGLVFLLQRSSGAFSWVRAGAGCLAVFLLAFTSMLVLAHDTDLNLTRYLGEKNRQYFTQSELAALEFAGSYRRDLPFYTDSQVMRYVQSASGITVLRSEDVLDPAAADESYLLYREEQFETRGQLTFPIGEQYYTSQVYYYRKGDELDLQERWEQENKVYDNGSVSLYLKQTGY